MTAPTETTLTWLSLANPRALAHQNPRRERQLAARVLAACAAVLLAARSPNDHAQKKRERVGGGKITGGDGTNPNPFAYTCSGAAAHNGT